MTTSTRFRNIDFDTDTPLSDWPAEAIEIVLDRGTLSDWQQIAAEIRRQPWGVVARTVESIAGWGEHYGIDNVMQAVIVDARTAVDSDARRRYADEIRRWRTAAGLTVRQLAALAGTSPARISDYENGRVAPTTDVLGRIETITATTRC